MVRVVLPAWDSSKTALVSMKSGLAGEKKSDLGLPNSKLLSYRLYLSSHRGHRCPGSLCAQTNLLSCSGRRFRRACARGSAPCLPLHAELHGSAFSVKGARRGHAGILPPRGGDGGGGEGEGARVASLRPQSTRRGSAHSREAPSFRPGGDPATAILLLRPLMVCCPTSGSRCSNVRVWEHGAGWLSVSPA